MSAARMSAERWCELMKLMRSQPFGFERARRELGVAKNTAKVWFRAAEAHGILEFQVDAERDGPGRKPRMWRVSREWGGDNR